MTGRDRNFPIVRTGHIAMMPDEKIPKVKIGDWEGNADAYLIESRSIGGWSGSPVFVRGTYYVPFSAIGRRREYNEGPRSHVRRWPSVPSRARSRTLAEFVLTQ